MCQSGCRRTLVAGSSLGISKISDLIAQAKAHPEAISCAVTGVGRLSQLMAELLQSWTDMALRQAQAWRPVLL
jgi:tripartite-type tricarboxylate transporter receptor subunit TctC